jgi:pimeloyl-ACP methyl ester carboxylesterase
MAIIRSAKVTLSSGPRAEIAYHVAGDGPAVLLLHGWATSWRLWQDTMIALADAGYRVYAPDHIGCGDSSKPWLFYTPHDYRVHIEGFVAALGLSSFILAGHSLGGHVALSYALAHPAQVSKLILVDPAYCPSRQLVVTRAELLLVLTALPVIGELALIMTPLRLMRWCIGQPWGGFYRPDRIDQDVIDRTALDYLQKACPLVSNSVAYLFVFSLPGLSLLWRDADLRPRLHELTMPVLVAWGRRDALLSAGSSQALSVAIPGATALPIAEAGHTPPVEATSEFVAGMLAFLAN